MVQRRHRNPNAAVMRTGRVDDRPYTMKGRRRAAPRPIDPDALAEAKAALDEASATLDEQRRRKAAEAAAAPAPEPKPTAKAGRHAMGACHTCGKPVTGERWYCGLCLSKRHV